MTSGSLVDGRPADRIPIDDRGLAYGDGVFETMLVADGRPVWWESHLARLHRGCARLGLAQPHRATLHTEAEQLCAGVERAALKLIVTRGSAGRGYAPDDAAACRRVLSVHPAPALSARDYRDGVALHQCRLRLALQPALAGIKHLNRLEQVLARAEWSDPALAEGLLLDARGRVVCATAANLFASVDGRLVTPRLDQCGIQGVCRDWIRARIVAEEIELDLRGLLGADELFLCSSLRGILPVARIGGQSFGVGAMTRQLQQALWTEVPALRPARGEPAWD